MEVVAATYWRTSESDRFIPSGARPFRRALFLCTRPALTEPVHNGRILSLGRCVAIIDPLIDW
jgi:hypothetical protein